MYALIVDDESDVRQLMGRMMARLGHRVSEASTGEEALNALRRDEPPDVVLLDWNLVGMDGLTLLRTIRAEKNLSTIRVMMVTGKSELDDVSVALEAGADEYLMKPVSTRALKEKLAILGW